MPPMEDPPADVSLNYARELMNRIRSCLSVLRTAGNSQEIEDTVKLARAAYVLTAENDTDRFAACLLLAESLH
jgi:hypothetical protein